MRDQVVRDGGSDWLSFTSADAKAKARAAPVIA